MSDFKVELKLFGNVLCSLDFYDDHLGLILINYKTISESTASLFKPSSELEYVVFDPRHFDHDVSYSDYLDFLIQYNAGNIEL